MMHPMLNSNEINDAISHAVGLADALVSATERLLEDPPWVGMEGGPKSGRTPDTRCGSVSVHREHPLLQY
jgi:hypothetical protein